MGKCDRAEVAFWVQTTVCKGGALGQGLLLDGGDCLEASKVWAGGRCQSGVSIQCVEEELPGDFSGGFLL